MENNTLHLSYNGCNFLRQRLVLSVLSGTAVTIQNIRANDNDPGVRGTKVTFHPGFLTGGKFEHDCCVQRGIGYYLEALICLAPFCKIPMQATLKGVTNNQMDPSIDAIRYGTLPVVRRFFTDDQSLELKTLSRGLPPGGGGSVLFCCPISKELRPIHLTDPGKIKRIRGVAYVCRMSPAVANRMVTSAKGVLLQYLPDVYLYTDIYKKTQGGKSPGFGITLVAETINGTFLTAEAMSHAAGSGKEPSVAEDVGREAAHLLLEEVYRGGCVDSNNQSVACLFMAVGQRNVSKVLTGPLSPYTIQFLRHLKDVFQVMFKLDAQPDEDRLRTGTEKVVLSCLGIGYTNLSRHRS